MSKAPEVIWANPNGDVISIRNGYPDLNTLIATGRLTKYVRADRIEELEYKLAKAVDALGEAIYLLDPDEEDIAKEAGLHRIVTTYAELTSSEAANGEAKGDKDE